MKPHFWPWAAECKDTINRKARDPYYKLAAHKQSHKAHLFKKTLTAFHGKQLKIKCKAPPQLSPYGIFLKITDQEAYNCSEEKKEKRMENCKVKAAIYGNGTFTSHHSEIRKECATKHQNF